MRCLFFLLPNNINILVCLFLFALFGDKPEVLPNSSTVCCSLLVGSKVVGFTTRDQSGPLVIPVSAPSPVTAYI